MPLTPWRQWMPLLGIFIGGAAPALHMRWQGCETTLRIGSGKKDSTQTGKKPSFNLIPSNPASVYMDIDGDHNSAMTNAIDLEEPGRVPISDGWYIIYLGSLTEGRPMHSSDKKTKDHHTPKNESPPKNKNASNAISSKAGDASPPKTEDGNKSDDLSSNYSRGEGQKPVSKAYKDNWTAIFAKKKR